MELVNFLLARDKTGHPISINYKGNEAHPSILGTLITIAIYVLVGLQLFNRTIALFEMSDPGI